MLTPPKWQTLWLQFKYSSRSVSNKIMFFKTAEKILDDISNCCSSTSKEITSEALSCWRMWIENQLVEDWKQNKTCYFAVRPLITVKYHPLHKDDEIIEMKLGLMWLALHKIQHLIQLEGPQYILEVFIQSCLSWLSCTEDLLPETSNLILKLINSLFTKDVPNLDKNGSFPPLEAYVLQSNKLFSRLLPSFLEIFYKWGKIKDKTDLLSIWNHFLGHCERSFKFIPVSIWHKIFKLVENICGDDKETIENKLIVLHKCATSLKSVMYNSKFIDSSQLLKTPAEVLLKLVIELSINNAEEKKSFEMFRYCNEICHVLSNQIIHTLGYESCIYILPKLEEISSKSLHWGLWCGLAHCFKDEMKNVDFDQYNEIELKIFKKLRSVAVNFDLDRPYLEENSILMIENQLQFLRIGVHREDCSVCIGKTVDLTLSQENQHSYDGGNSPAEILEEEEIYDYEGYFGFDIFIKPKLLTNRHKKKLQCLPVLSKNFESYSFPEVNEEVVSSPNNSDKFLWVDNSGDGRWLRHNFSFKNFNVCNLLFSDTELVERLTLHGYKARRSFVFAPAYVTIALQEIIRKTRKNSEPLCNNLIENVKKFQNKLSKCRFFTPVKLSVSLDGSEGVKFCKDFLRYLEGIEDIVNDVDFGKNLNNLMTKNDNSLVCFCMFSFLVNFTFNFVIEHSGNNSCPFKKFYVGEGTVLSRKITDFTKKVVHYKERLSKSDFMENMSKILPRNDDNPLVLWSKNNSAIEMNKDNMHKKSRFQGVLNENALPSVPNDLVIFKYFDELQNKFSSEIDSSLNVRSTRGRKRKYCSNDTGKYSQNSTGPDAVDVKPRPVFACGKIWENKNVKVILAPPDVFRSLTFSEMTPDIDSKECDSFDRKPEAADYASEEVDCDRWNYSLEDGSPARERNLSFDIKPDSKHDELSRDEKPTRKRKGRKVESQSKTKENRPLPCKEPYFLRRRPLKLPLKFKAGKNLYNREKGESTPKKVTPKNCNRVSGEVGATEKELADDVGLTPISDSCTSDALPSTVKVEVEVIWEENVHDNESFSKADVQIAKRENYARRIRADIVDVGSILEDVDKCEPESSCITDTPANKMGLTTDGECEIGDMSSPVTTRKRLASSIDDNVCRKKLKLEPDAHKESTQETVFKNTEAKSDISPKKESIDLNESKKTCAEAENAGKKTQGLASAIQSRASRMLALITESPGLGHVCETSPSSRHQAAKPHVNKNSRASKMLALLPEILEARPNVEVIHVGEPGARVNEENTGKETSGHVTGKTHHLRRNVNTVITGSPNRSPLRQKKWINFDEDKNETVTYFTDSPPCLLRRDFKGWLNK